MAKLGSTRFGPAKPYEFTRLGRFDAFFTGLNATRFDKLDVPTLERFNEANYIAKVEAQYRAVNQPIAGRVLVPYLDGRGIPVDMYREMTSTVTPQPELEQVFADYAATGE